MAERRRSVSGAGAFFACKMAYWLVAPFDIAILGAEKDDNSVFGGRKSCGRFRRHAQLGIGIPGKCSNGCFG